MTDRPSLVRRVISKITSAFPNHQIYFRTDGKVRFFTLTTGMQLTALFAVCVVSLWLGKSTFEYFAQGDRLQASRVALNKMFGQVEALNDDMEGLEARILQRAALIEARQSALQDILTDGLIAPEALPLPALSDDAVQAGDAEIKARQREAYNRLQRGQGTAPEAHYDSVFAMLEKRQNAFLTALSDVAEQEKDEILTLLSDLNIDPERFLAMGAEDSLLASAAGTANTGGPLVELASLTDGSGNPDPLLTLAEDWSDLKQLRERILSVPAVAPVKKFYVSSKYGKRRDPFSRRWAHHSGIDLAAWYGTPITATSDGLVTYAGYKAGYGRVVEVDHGNGFVTRYGHLRKVVAKKGQSVTLGDKLGETGSTGRSTGPHVHYEIWFDGETVDPGVFIKASDNVLKIQGRSNRG